MQTGLVDRILELAVNIQQIPAPTFFEKQRAEYIHSCFQAEGLRDVWLDSVGNVYARLGGEAKRLPVIVSAHLDTVFPAKMKMDVIKEKDRIIGAGIGDNALGVAGLLGLVWALKQRRTNLCGDLWLVANVGEEGLGDLSGMRAVVDRFGSQISAYLVLEGMALGHVYHQGLEVNRYRIGVVTPGGHSWVNQGSPSAIHELAKLVTHLTNLPIPKQPRTTINVGVINGGISVNTIAPEAYLELDLRSEDEETLKNLSRQVIEVVEQVNSPDIQATATLIGNRPRGGIPADHPLVRLAIRCLEAQGIRPQLNIGSTDANIPLNRGLPAICIGLTTGRGAHTMGESIEISPLGKGLNQLVELVEGVYQLEGNQ